MNFELDADQERDLLELARQRGKEPGELVRELLRKAIAEEKSNGGSPPAADGSAFDAFQGFVGSAPGLPRDLSTSPKHLEGFGA